MSRSIEPEGREPDPRRTSRPGIDRSDRQDRLRENTIPRLREAIDRAAQDRPTMSELINRLDEAGIRAIPSIQKSGRLNGMSYAFNGRLIRGSDLGRPYTAEGLQKSKGVRYDPRRDLPRLAEAAKEPREALVVSRFPRDGHDRDRANRTREFDGLSAAQRASLREIGRFRTVSVADFIHIQYRGDRGAWRQDFSRLVSQKLVEHGSVVVATHSKSRGRNVQSLPIVVLTKKGKDLLRRCDRDALSSRQALYAGFVKPREVAHDAAIYRMYQAEAAVIAGKGGQVRRVVLDFELKKRVYSPLAKARGLDPSEYTRKQAQIAQDNGLKVVEGKIRFPDLRVEYETESGDACRVDLELATEHYRGEHMAAKGQAGFKIYADSASFPRLGAGGSDGGSPAFDHDHIMDIFSF
ncbi:MAG: hypothetical protein M3Z85_11360 [Acidobacteriota bacterium]|nr:hypothetical protein [Acidobacteriota bacterium]